MNKLYIYKPPLILFNKPYGVVCQFSQSLPHECLADYIKIPNIYPAGRLDVDSEGLLLLTADGALQHKLSHPKFGKWKTYWVQVEGIASDKQLDILRNGVMLGDYTSKPAKVKIIKEPDTLWLRTPPIRERKHIPTSWLEISLQEGKNRQVRRMTANVGLPTLRLIRYSIDNYTINGILNGEYQELALRI